MTYRGAPSRPPLPEAALLAMADVLVSTDELDEAFDGLGRWERWPFGVGWGRRADLNTGVVFFRATNGSLAFIQAWRLAMLAKRDTGEHTNDQFVFVSMVHQAEMQPVTARADHMVAWRATLRAHGLDRPGAFAAVTPSTRGVSISKADFPSAAPCLPRNESLGRAGCAANRFTLGALPPLQPDATHTGCDPMPHTGCHPMPHTLPAHARHAAAARLHERPRLLHAARAGLRRPRAEPRRRPRAASCLGRDGAPRLSRRLSRHPDARAQQTLRARRTHARTVRTTARTLPQVHFTFQYSDTPDFPHGKRQRAREAALWTADPPSYYTEGRYVKLVGALYTAAQRVAIERRYPEWSPHRHMAIDAIQRAAVRDLLAFFNLLAFFIPNSHPNPNPTEPAPAPEP